MQSPKVYTILKGHDAQYRVSPAGKAIVTIRNATPLKFRNIYVGTASAGFAWVSSGKSSSWMFEPTLLKPKPAQFTESKSENGDQVLNVELGKEAMISPAVGFLSPNLSGAMQASAIHIDIPLAYDVWIFLLRSTPAPLNLRLDKTELAVSTDSDCATASLRRTVAISGPEIATELSALSTTFRKVRLSVNRKLKTNTPNIILSGEETFGEAKIGSSSFTWKPTQRKLDLLFITSYAMTIKIFADFLAYLGAEITPSLHLSGNYLKSSFILNDGPQINYAVRLTGEKRILGKVVDEANMVLSY